MLYPNLIEDVLILYVMPYSNLNRMKKKYLENLLSWWLNAKLLNVHWFTGSRLIDKGDPRNDYQSQKVKSYCQSSAYLTRMKTEWKPARYISE